LQHDSLHLNADDADSPQIDADLTGFVSLRAKNPRKSVFLCVNLRLREQCTAMHKSVPDCYGRGRHPHPAGGWLTPRIHVDPILGGWSGTNLR